MPLELAERRTRLAARLLLKAADAPLSLDRDIRVAEILAKLEVCDDSRYERIFASLGRPDFRPWQVPSPTKDLWKTLGGRPPLGAARAQSTAGRAQAVCSAPDDWFFEAAPAR